MSHRGPHVPLLPAAPPSLRQPPRHSKSSVQASPPAFFSAHFPRMHWNAPSQTSPGQGSPYFDGAMPATHFRGA